MDTIIITQLWMERDDKYGAFARSYAVTFYFSKDFDAWPVLGDPRSAYENRLYRAAIYSDLERCFEAADLTAEGVALGADVDNP